MAAGTPVLDVTLKASRQLLLAALLVHLLTAAACVCGPLPGLVLPVVANACLLLRQHWFALRRQPARLRHDAGGWTLGGASAAQPVEVLPSSVVWYGLIVLRLRPLRARRRLTLLVLSDSASPDSLRRLRAALRCAAAV